MSKRLASHKASLIAIIFGFLIVFIAYTPIRRYSLDYLYKIFNPILSSNNFISYSLSNFLASYLTHSDLASTNQQLRQEIVKLYRENINLKFLRQENKTLKSELQFVSSYNYRHLVAHVIGHGASYLNTQLIIDKGYLDGLRIGLPVVADRGILIGRLSKIEQHISYVRLLTDNQSKLSVNIIGDRPALGFLHGEHNLNLKVEFLPKDISLHKGDLASTSGLDLNIPGGLLIGKIYNLSFSQKDLWQEAYVEPLLDYQVIYFVDILLPKVK